jgi:predicted nucleic acid-binding protein
VRSVVIDANVFVSFLVERNQAQHTAARALLSDAEDGKIAGIIPQSVIFEIAYVLQSQYGLTGQRLATTVRAVVTFPGMRIVDDCSWKRVLEIWPDPLPGLADAAIIAVATTNRYEAVATFDRKLSNRLESFGLAKYW